MRRIATLGLLLFALFCGLGVHASAEVAEPLARLAWRAGNGGLGAGAVIWAEKLALSPKKGAQREELRGL